MRIKFLDGIAVETGGGFSGEGRRRGDPRVRHRVGEVNEERAILAPADKRDRRVGVALCQGGHVGVVFLDLGAAQQIHRGVVARGRAEKLVEALMCREQVQLIRGGFLGMPGEIPLAEGSGGVAARLQDFGDGDFLRVKPRVMLDHVLSFGHAERIASRHQRGARGTTHRLRVETGEAHPLGREAIQVRRADALPSIGTQVAVAEIVGQDDDDVWRAGSGGCGRGGGGGRHPNAQQGGNESEAGIATTLSRRGIRHEKITRGG